MREERYGARADRGGDMGRQNGDEKGRTVPSWPRRQVEGL